MNKVVRLKFGKKIKTIYIRLKTVLVLHKATDESVPGHLGKMKLPFCVPAFLLASARKFVIRKKRSPFPNSSYIGTGNKSYKVYISNNRGTLRILFKLLISFSYNKLD